MPAEVVRELSNHQSVSCLIVAFVIARVVSLSCYSSVKTRICLVKSYQINESFCSTTRCPLLCLLYHLTPVSTHFRCSDLHVCPLSLPCYYCFKPIPPYLNRIFDFSITFSHCISVGDSTVLTLWTCKSVQVPFNVREFYKLFNKFDQPYYSPPAVS